MPSEKATEAFIAFINELIEKFAIQVYQESQAAVPVVSGELKASGSINKTANGMKIEYTAPYASLIDGHGDNSTMIYRGGKSYRFPKDPVRARGIVSNTIDTLAETMLPQLMMEASVGAASRTYKLYIEL